MSAGHLEIIPVKYGESVLAESMIFENGAEDKFRPIVFLVYLIRTEKRLVLVDAGCETMPGFDMKNYIGPIKALEKIGVSPDEVTDVIITHAHHDHIECVPYFKKAVIYIQKDEYKAGKGYFTPDLQVRTFEEEAQIGSNVKAIKIGGHSVGSCIVEITDEESSYIIAGDECYQRECLDRQIPTGSSYYPEKSQGFVKKYSDCEYRVLLCHEE